MKAVRGGGGGEDAAGQVIPEAVGQRDRTIRMPYLPHKPHRRRAQRVVFGELELRREDAAFVGSALWALDQCFPDEDVVFADGAGGYAVRGGGG